MADTRLLQALDYILNDSDASTIEALSEAVVRRRRDLSVFNAMGGLGDPQGMAKELTERINSGVGGGIENMRKSIREMIVRIIREHAPELSDSQVDELCRAWLPEPEGEKNVPRDMLQSMIEQFISFSRGTMNTSVDKNLRDEIGAWPERYWKIFPPVIRQTITDLLKDKISEEDFNSRISIALR
jgi:hypothetical protein